VIQDVKAFGYNVVFYAEVSTRKFAIQLHNKMYCVVEIGGSSKQ